MNTDCFVRAVQWVRSGRKSALATVIGVSGSAPRHIGAHMVVCDDGATFGTIGGGRVEAEVTEAACAVARDQVARRVVHHLVRDLAMCCGGSMELYIEPLANHVDALERVIALSRSRQRALLVTALDAAEKSVEPWTPTSGRHTHVRGQMLFEPIVPTDRLLLFGCGHVARAIGPMARSVGFDVVVCDDGRTGALERDPPWASAVVPSFDAGDVVRQVGALGDGDYVAIVTRDHAIDQRLVEQLLASDVSYLGMIGSRGKVGRFKKRIEAKGMFDADQWARLRAPIGIDIGAETPEEIAVSVVAQLIATRRARQ